VFFVVLGTIIGLDLVWWFVADRLVRRRKWPRRVVAGFAVLQLVLAAIVIVDRLGPTLPLPKLFEATVLIWHLILLPLSLVIYLLLSPAVYLTRPKQPEVEAGPTRRAFLSTLAVAPPAVTLAAAGVGVWQTEHFRVRPITVRLPNLPAALDGMTLAHVSDTHVGEFTHGDVLGEIAEATNKLDVDLTVLTGDLINHSLSDLPAAAEMIAAMKARHGVLCIEGNHDLFEGWKKFDDKARDLGIDLLVNQTRQVTINGQLVDVMGLQWGGPRGGAKQSRGYQRSDAAIRDSFDEMQAARANSSGYPILLAHHPHAFEAAADAGVELTLAGHTHGGQLMLPGGVGFGPLMYRYWSGLHGDGRGNGVIVSNGTGNWFPIRTFAPAEIIHVTLRRADMAAGAARTV
jgi:predicted MPP superfamily phosphohydrolase